MAADLKLDVRDIAKSFRLHLQGGVHIPVIERASFEVRAGECAVLRGPSGKGKSTILKMIFGNYRVERGSIWVRHGEGFIDVAASTPQTIMNARRNSMGYVSQFLRCLPRIPARDVVAQPLRLLGIGHDDARRRAGALLERLAIPSRLFDIPPATFSGGEQQRVNIARGLINGSPLLLLDEPTASLDATNRHTVVELLRERRQEGSALVAVIHDDDVRTAIADREIDIEQFRQSPGE